MSASSSLRCELRSSAGLGGHVRGVADHADHLTVGGRERRQHVAHDHVATTEVADGDATDRNLPRCGRFAHLVEEGKR